LINNDLIPKVGCYGGLGASGDLPQNGRVLSVLRQLPGTKIWSETGFIDASQALKSKGFKPLILAPKAGLGLVNGDNFSTAAAFHLTRETLFALLTQAVAGAMMFEMTLATNRSLHPLIYKIRKHQGQEEVASLYLNLIQDSQYIRNEMKELLPSVDGRKVQDVYSIRCLSQFFGVSWERVKWAMDTVEINANSASDNPLWTTDDTRLEGEKPGQWVSGGNFIAEYMVEVMDALRKTITQIVKVNDRHMSKLIDPHENNGLTPNLSYKDAISQCTFKGIQAQAGMFEVYSTFLSMPISTLFGVHEQNNQDITSHAMTSGLIGRENLQVCWLSLAQLMIALAQAVDLREGSSKLSSKTKKIYDFVRQDIEFAKTEKPLGPEIELIASKLQTIEFRNLLVEEVLS
ncbi:aromatic amino acid lyase, partial [Candidatus Beckwithbacteria bacterium]|nr:aromatic amino acid lyase [Candidatus Beckwithbacteria bacterium]